MGPVSTLNGLRGGDDVRLQLEQFRRRLRANAGDAQPPPAREVVEFEGLQLHRGHVGGGENLSSAA